MVLVDGLKYACAACIKGHRSSSCTHSDRPLFEIKRKGRPVTQCGHCRQLRKTKQVHVKCSCGAGDEDGGLVKPRNKGKRKIPSTATFPDGLRGPSSSASPVPEQPPQRSDGCSCDLSSGSCACATPVSKKSGRSRASSSGASSTMPPIQPQIQSGSSCCGGKSKLAYHPRSRSNARFDTHSLDNPDNLAGGITPQPLAPIQSYTSNSTNTTLPTMFSWPSGVEACHCGITCVCPGCHEHSDPSSALMSSEPCPYACATCTVCGGFAFAPAPSDSWTPGGRSSRPLQTLDAQSSAYQSSPPVLASTSAFNPFTSNNPSTSSKSPCCGGSCKCSAEILGCDCDEDCCGCCFGCSCSDGSDTADQEDCGVRGHLGFAVSGLRASCRGDTKDGEDKGDSSRKKKRKIQSGGTRSRTGTFA